MEKYEILLDGIPISVITASTPASERVQIARELVDGGYAILIYPVSGADVGVTCIDKSNAELREPHLPLAALSYFFREIRHLPSISLDVMICGKVYELAL